MAFKFTDQASRMTWFQWIQGTHKIVDHYIHVRQAWEAAPQLPEMQSLVPSSKFLIKYNGELACILLALSKDAHWITALKAGPLSTRSLRKEVQVRAKSWSVRKSSNGVSTKSEKKAKSSMQPMYGVKFSWSSGLGFWHESAKRFSETFYQGWQY